MTRTLDALPRPLAYLLRSLAVALPLALFIALFFTIAFNDSFGVNLVYSLCIGLICQLSIDLGRRAAARGLRRLGNGAAPAGAGDWPGWPITLVVVVLGIALGVNLGYALAGWLLGMPAAAPSLDNPRTLFVVLTVSTLASVGFVVVSWGRARLAQIDAQRQRAQRAAAENQLKLLESQLEPHMLFNSLANLRVLIGTDPARAQAMLDRLIAFLRATLQASRTGTHTLALEFERLRDYLELMRVRMGPRLHFSLDLPDDLGSAPVPPLLLQPLVENAIRHGLEPKIEGGGVEVSARREGRCLVLCVRDDGVGLTAAAVTAGTRFGLQQVRERLAALHGAAASLALEARPEGGAQARMVLPLE